MSASDYIDTQSTRDLQSDPKVVAANYAMLLRWGAYNLLKVKSFDGGAPSRITGYGYFTLLPAISGKTPQEMRRILGLRKLDLSGGALIYRLSRVPRPNEFVVRGYTTLVDGLRLAPGRLQDGHGYRPGHGAWQGALTKGIPMTLVASLKPGMAFEPGLHPKYR